MTVENFSRPGTRGYLRPLYIVSSCPDILKVWLNLQRVFSEVRPTLKEYAGNIVGRYGIHESRNKNTTTTTRKTIQKMKNVLCSISNR